MVMVMPLTDFARMEAHVRAWALRYRRLGFAPLPTHVGLIENGRYVCTCGTDCGKSAGKHPAIDWTRFQLQRPTPQQVHSWFLTRYAGFNVGMVHGPISRTVVLDWDGDEGLETRKSLEHRLGKLPSTPTVLTGGGGSHQLYRHPGIHIPTAAGLESGFDVRGDGGFSVLPPSTHATVREYVWDVDHHIDDMPLADLPAAWVDFISRPAAGGSSGKTAVTWRPAPNGSRLVTDGRETFMRDVVWQVTHRLIRELGRLPSDDELYQEAVQAYAPLVDFSKSGRGLDQLEQKCRAILRRLISGRIAPKAMTDLERARASFAWMAAKNKGLYSR